MHWVEWISAVCSVFLPTLVNEVCHMGECYYLSFAEFNILYQMHTPKWRMECATVRGVLCLKVPEWATVYLRFIIIISQPIPIVGGGGFRAVLLGPLSPMG